MQLIFGAGDFYGVPLLDAQGNTISNPTPIKVGAMQEMSIEFSGDLKELHGQNQFAIAVGRGKVKSTGKIKGAQIHGAALNSLFFGNGVTAGTMMAISTDAVGTAIPSTPYTITPTPPASGTWVEDLGVLNSNAVPLTRVASAPATGQYSVAAGVYTFAAADTGNVVYINYRYSYTLAAAKRIALTNLPMGYAPTFGARMQTTFQGKKTLVVLASVVSTKLMLFSTKQDDFSVPEIDFTAQADASGTTLGDIYVQE
ncbi:MAG: hypothetical protein XXXNARYT_003411 [Candidatus Accumulibacter regalis]|jgi:hypothetical protein|uniref:hypothetical protein n=1 Tax=Candidatus Accumulibacter sp. ACC005 TaxID=2823331 RepID=UPI0025C32734|nr:hypothetical protein [Candidatus Accumulibacter sp. ACC005]